MEPFVAGHTRPPYGDPARSFMGYIVSVENARARGVSAPPAPTLPADLGSKTTDPPSTLRPDFRKLQPGEERLEGLLTNIECAPGKGVTFHIKAGGQDVPATATSLSAVEFITFRDDVRDNISCGPLATAMNVYLTWKPGPSTGTKVAVAIEFLPKGMAA
jgi:hypothetical protein